MIRTLAIVALLAAASPVVGAPNEQLVRSVEQRLAVIGLRGVDVSLLDTSQVAALHMKLQGGYADFHRRTRTRQEVKVILQWDGSQIKSR